MTEIATCPQCARALRVPPELIGQRVKCPACATTFTAGGEGRPDEAPPPAHREPAPERAPERPASRERDEDRDRDERRPRQREDEYEDRDERRPRGRDEEEDYPRPRRSRYEDDEDYPRASRRRYEDEDRVRRRDKPGKVQAIAIMALVGGIWAVLHGLGSFGGSRGACCFWPGTYYCLVSGVLAIIKGAQLLGENSRLHAVPMVTGVLLIINIVGLDVVGCVLGILIVVFCSDPEVRSHFRG